MSKTIPYFVVELEKKGRARKMNFLRPWATRTFKLTGQFFDYYDGDTNKGTIITANATAKAINSSEADGRPFPFTIDNGLELVVLSAADEATREKCLVLINLSAKNKAWKMPLEYKENGTTGTKKIASTRKAGKEGGEKVLTAEEIAVIEAESELKRLAFEAQRVASVLRIQRLARVAIARMRVRRIRASYPQLFLVTFFGVHGLNRFSSDAFEPVAYVSGLCLRGSVQKSQIEADIKRSGVISHDIVKQSAVVSFTRTIAPIPQVDDALSLVAEDKKQLRQSISEINIHKEAGAAAVATAGEAGGSNVSAPPKCVEHGALDIKPNQPLSVALASSFQRLDTIVLTIFDSASPAKDDFLGQVLIRLSDYPQLYYEKSVSVDLINIPVLRYVYPVHNPSSDIPPVVTRKRVSGTVSFRLTAPDRNYSMCGYIWKVSESLLSAAWKRRWFVLVEGQLQYYNSEHSLEQPKNVVYCKDVYSIEKSETYKGRIGWKISFRSAEVDNYWLIDFDIDEQMPIRHMWIRKLFRSCPDLAFTDEDPTFEGLEGVVAGLRKTTIRNNTQSVREAAMAAAAAEGGGRGEGVNSAASGLVGAGKQKKPVAKRLSVFS